MAKDRMDRKELRQPDEFVTATTGALEWARKHANTVLAVAGGLLAILLGIGFYNSQQAARLHDSNSDLSSGLASFRSEDFAVASTQLDQVATQWKSEAVGPLAGVMAANSRLRAGDADGAIAALGALDDAGLPHYIRQQRALVWASALEAKGDWAAAAAKYAEAAAVEGPYSGEALVGEARSRARNGDTDAAAKLYRRIVEEYPDRPDSKLLSAKLG